MYKSRGGFQCVLPVFFIEYYLEPFTFKQAMNRYYKTMTIFYGFHGSAKT